MKQKKINRPKWMGQQLIKSSKKIKTYYRKNKLTGNNKTII